MRQILLSFMVESTVATSLIEGFNAPLGTLSTRTAAAFSLGLISEREYKETNVLRRIRNEFAHEVHRSFADQDIRDLCNNLTFAIQEPAVSPRVKYSSSAALVIVALTNKPAYVSRQRLQHNEWPV
jgi:mannitol operon repressor